MNLKTDWLQRNTREASQHTDQWKSPRLKHRKEKKIDKTHNKIRDVGQHKRSNLSEIPKKNKKQKFPPLVKYINKL